MNIHERVAEDIQIYFAQQIKQIHYKLYKNKNEITKLSEENKAYKKLLKRLNSLKDKFDK